MGRLQRLLLISAFGCACSAALRAQLPQDNNAWQERCTLLQASNRAILAGRAPAVLVRATRGIAGLQYMTVGFDRRRAFQHNVTCTLFYMAAMAESGGKPDPAKSRTYAEVALAEFQQARGQKVPLSERIKRFDAISTRSKRPPSRPNSSKRF